jgi:hypothetical protein
VTESFEIPQAHGVALQKTVHICVVCNLVPRHNANVSRLPFHIKHSLRWNALMLRLLLFSVFSSFVFERTGPTENFPSNSVNRDASHPFTCSDEDVQCIWSFTPAPSVRLNGWYLSYQNMQVVICTGPNVPGRSWLLNWKRHGRHRSWNFLSISLEVLHQKMDPCYESVTSQYDRGMLSNYIRCLI